VWGIPTIWETPPQRCPSNIKRNRASTVFNGCENAEYIEDENTIILLEDKEIMHICIQQKKHMWL
jgi:hypothetical protein